MAEKFELDIERLKSGFSFKVDGGLTHTHCKRFKLFPFSTKDKDLSIDKSGISGTFSRKLCNQKLTNAFDVKTFLEAVECQVSEFEGANAKEILKDIVKSTLIQDNGLVNFNIRTLNYLPSNMHSEKIGEFLCSILVTERLRKLALEHYDHNVDNMLYQLVLNALPELKQDRNNTDVFKSNLEFVKELFEQDFKFLITHEELYKDTIGRVLEYYFMFYSIQMALKLNKFEKADLLIPDKVYFTVSWESLSKTRKAYKYGLENLKAPIATLFSHAITLEMLNYHNLESQLNYVDLAALFNGQETNQASESIKELICEYTKQLKDVRWHDFKYIGGTYESEDIEKVHELFERVQYQFTTTTRNRASEAYRNWLLKYIQQSFCKKRGPLGYTLSLDEDDIILLIKLCIKKEPKMKLSNLFAEFEKRGISFDRDTQNKVIQLFEKLNILEKKSDSGDAQYVRSIL